MDKHEKADITVRDLYVASALARTDLNAWDGSYDIQIENAFIVADKMLKIRNKK